MPIIFIFVFISVSIFTLFTGITSARASAGGGSTAKRNRNKHSHNIGGPQPWMLNFNQRQSIFSSGSGTPTTNSFPYQYPHPYPQNKAHTDSDSDENKHKHKYEYESFESDDYVYESDSDADTDDEYPGGRRRRLLATLNSNSIDYAADCSTLNDTAAFTDPFVSYLCRNESFPLDYFYSTWEPSNYSCFGEDEAQINAYLRSAFPDLDDSTLNVLRGIGADIDIVFDEWGLLSQAAYILMREVFGFNAYLRCYYDESITVVEYGRPAHVIMEVYPSDILGIGYDTAFQTLLPDSIFSSLSGIRADSFWALHKSVATEVLRDIIAFFNDTTLNDTVFLDFFRSYTVDDVVDFMELGDLFINYTGDLDYDAYDETCHSNVTYNTTHNDRCVNNTWYSNACKDDNSFMCTTLIQWLPYYNDFEDRAIIQDYNMRIKILYIGGEWNVDSQSFFDELMQNKSRVLYAFFSPSTWTSSGEFELIRYPLKANLGKGERSYKLIPSRFAKESAFGYNFLVQALMANEDYETILRRVWEIDGAYETYPHRTNETCHWLKNNTDVWLSWIPDISDYVISCQKYSDSSFQKLVDINFAKVNVSEYDWSEFIDAGIAQRIRTQCLSKADSHPGALIAAQTMTGVAFLYVLALLIGLIYYRNKKIMGYSAWKLLIIALIGALFGTTYVWFSDSSQIGICYARIYVSQTSFVCILASLYLRTLRLERIWHHGLHGKMVRISDLNLSLRILAILAVVFTLTGVLQGVYGYRIARVVFDKEVYMVCQSTDSVMKYVEIALLCIEILCFLSLGLLAWKLRHVNKQYNEAKHIAVILYNTCLFILLLIVFKELNLDPYSMFSIEGFIWIIMVLVNISILLIPKFCYVFTDVQFLDPRMYKASHDEQGGGGSGVHRDGTYEISVDTPSKKDRKMMTRVLKKMGYDVIKRAPGQSGAVSSMRTRTEMSSKTSIDKHRFSAHKYTEPATATTAGGGNGRSGSGGGGGASVAAAAPMSEVDYKRQPTEFNPDVYRKSITIDNEDGNGAMAVKINISSTAAATAAVNVHPEHVTPVGSVRDDNYNVGYNNGNDSESSVNNMGTAAATAAATTTATKSIAMVGNASRLQQQLSDIPEDKSKANLTYKPPPRNIHNNNSESKAASSDGDYKDSHSGADEQHGIELTDQQSYGDDIAP